MDKFFVYFKHNRAHLAVQISGMAGSETKRINGRNIEWVVVQARNRFAALAAAEDFIDNLIEKIYAKALPVCSAENEGNYEAETLLKYTGMNTFIAL